MTAAKHSYSRRKYIQEVLNEDAILMVCIQMSWFRFQTPPVSAHGLIALCVLGCVSNNLTLIQAALQEIDKILGMHTHCLLYTSPSPRDATLSRMPSSA